VIKYPIVLVTFNDITGKQDWREEMALIEEKCATCWCAGFLVDDGKTDGVVRIASMKEDEGKLAGGELIPLGCIKLIEVLNNGNTE